MRDIVIPIGWRWRMLEDQKLKVITIYILIPRSIRATQETLPQKQINQTNQPNRKYIYFREPYWNLLSPAQNPSQGQLWLLPSSTRYHLSMFPSPFGTVKHVFTRRTFDRNTNIYTHITAIYAYYIYYMQYIKYTLKYSIFIVYILYIYTEIHKYKCMHTHSLQWTCLNWGTCLNILDIRSSLK